MAEHLLGGGQEPPGKRCADVHRFIGGGVLVSRTAHRLKPRDFRDLLSASAATGAEYLAA
jgi:hypothetical protein